MRDDFIVMGVFEEYERSVRYIMKRMGLPQPSHNVLVRKSRNRNNISCRGPPPTSAWQSAFVERNSLDAKLHALARLPNSRHL